ncbi:hypothetical protein B566_EDAN001383 [Ephemera danica]|nr:hypothetical protein B566_EDAN001383 [Ephemera danica]
MRVVGLVSGGKDSCYNMMQCVAAGHTLVALANLQPETDGEIDSYMYQSVAHEGVSVLAEAMDLPLYQQVIRGSAKQTGKSYKPEDGDEVEDLFTLLTTIQRETGIDAVSVGAILSDYQRTRVENVCTRLGLTTFAFLWQRDQSELLAEMVSSGVQAILVKVAALGLDPALHLGRDIAEVAPHLLRMKEKWGLNVCGEGGEYETFTLDCPLFNKAIVIDDYETVIHDDNAIAPVGYLSFKKMRLIDKTDSVTSLPVAERLEALGVRRPQDFLNGSDQLLIDGQEEEEANGDEEKDETDQLSSTPCVPLEIKFEDQLYNVARVQSNQAGWCWVTGVAGKGSSCSEAMSDALNVLQDLLASQHLELSDVVGISLWVRDLQQFAALNAVFSTRLNHSWEPPVRACVEAALPDNWPVLLEATAHRTPPRLPDSGEDQEWTRQVLHVQSLSHWAPASIGPYSQAVKGVCYLTSPSAVQTVRQLWETRTTNAIVDFVIVPALPRGSQVEWSVWAHSKNRQFEYEETGCRLGDEGDSPKASIRSRWNYDSTVAAVVCYVEGRQDSASLCLAVDYALGKLLREAPANSALSLRAFYRTGSIVSAELCAALDSAREDLARQGLSLGCTLIPVCALHDQNTVLSLCGLRYQ